MCMEIKDLKALVELDEKTRSDVEKAHTLKSNLKKAISDEKQKIADETWKQIKILVEQKKQELDESVKQDELENRQEYEAKASKLKDTFEANKDKWCNDILERCLQ